ncbi:MAG: SMP-30/gluconolactonase/LRE family protein [Bryobacteraceae bacterium]
MSQIKVAVATHDSLGESPVWDSKCGCLYWADITGRLVHQWHPASDTRRSWALEEKVGSIGLRASGGLVLALRSGIGLFDISDASCTFLVRLHADQPDMRFNDGRCDAAGCFWVGSMNDRTCGPEGSLYRFDPQHRLQEKLSGICIPNSLCWAPDGRTMYFSDSRQGVIWAFGVDRAGEIGSRRVFATITPPGVPDGATVDCEGFVWCALYGGWSVARFAPDGRLDRITRLPVQQPTSCAFGGPDLDTLYVTTARQGLDPDVLRHQPLAGDVLSLDPGVRGCVESRFAG